MASLGDILGGIGKSNAGQTAIGYGVGGLVTPLLAPLTTLEQQQLWAKFTDLALTPADVADMVVQDVYTDMAQAYQEASYSGISSDRLDKLIAVRGLPPGTAEMMTAWRRGLIDEATFRQVVRESHTKTKYTDVLVAMKDQVLTADLAIELALKGAITTDHMLTITRANGITDADAQAILAGTGNPLSPTEAIELLNRGEITQDEFTKIVRLGRTRNDQIPMLLKLRRKLPSVFELRSLISTGAITDAEGTKIATEQGLDPTVAAGIVKAAHSTKSTRVHQLTEAQVLSLYESGHMTVAETRKALALIGYSAHDVDLLIALVDARIEAGYITKATSRVHNSYVHRLIDLPEARRELERLRVPSAAIDKLITDWEIEREATVRRLTEAQVVKAAKDSIITPESAYTRLVAMGYPPEDAGILVQLETGQLPKGAPKPS